MGDEHRYPTILYRSWVAGLFHNVCQFLYDKYQILSYRILEKWESICTCHAIPLHQKWECILPISPGFTPGPVFFLYVGKTFTLETLEQPKHLQENDINIIGVHIYPLTKYGDICRSPWSWTLFGINYDVTEVFVFIFGFHVIHDQGISVANVEWTVSVTGPTPCVASCIELYNVLWLGVAGSLVPQNSRYPTTMRATR